MKVRPDYRIAGCIAVELACAEIYRGFHERFPETGGLWNDLAVENKEHATSLMMDQGGSLEDGLPDISGFHTVPFINETLDLARSIRQRMQDGEITLEEALRLSLELEKSAVEAFFWDVFTGESDQRVLARMKHLIEKQQSHGRKITLLMEGKGLAHKGFRPDIPGD